MNRFADNVLATIKSKRFFQFVIGFFIFESAWIALTASYPQAFDENFHFGLIQVYSHYWLPFLSHQPANANAYGAVARDPSYLYHYLLSFPYRLIAHFVHTQSYQIIILRFLNIALFTAGIVLFKKILKKVKLSEGLANLILLLFCLIPIVPQLAGQINYDNMLFPLVAVVCLLTFKVIDQVKRLRLSYSTVMLLSITALLTSLVKYAFLPIFLSIVVFFTYFLLRHYRAKIPELVRSFIKDFKHRSIYIKVGLIAALIICLGMFMQRDVVNLVEYHAIEPNCAKVLSVSQCSFYPPWAADYSRHQQVLANQVPAASKSLLFFASQWVYWMWYRLFFAVNGPNNSYQNFPPLPLPSAIALFIAIAGIFAVIRFHRELFRANPYAVFMLMASLLYLIALAIQGYATYQFTAILENMNGRYLLPVLLLVIALVGKAFSIALKNSSTAKVALACIAIIFFIEGGGIITFINRSNESWDWQNTKVIKVNNAARHVTSKVIVNGRNSYNTPYWFFN
ncbi:MAG TPA: hypothetical protein VIH90_04040 [Candidatus Saccharimonadales bacterium]